MLRTTSPTSLELCSRRSEGNDASCLLKTINLSGRILFWFFCLKTWILSLKKVEFSLSILYYLYIIIYSISLLSLVYFTQVEEVILYYFIYFSIILNTVELKSDSFITEAKCIGKDPRSLQDRLQELPEQHWEETGPTRHGKPVLRTQDGSGRTKSPTGTAALFLPRVYQTRRSSNSTRRWWLVASRHLVGVWPERLPQKPPCEDRPGKGKLRGGPAGRESTEADPRQSALHSFSLQVHLACRHTQRRLLPVQPPHHWLLPAGGVGRRHRPAGGWDHRSDLTPENLRSSPRGWACGCLWADVVSCLQIIFGRLPGTRN